MQVSPDTIGYLGPDGSHSSAAARAFADSPFWPGGFNPVRCATLLDVLQGAEQGDFTIGILPVENALEGSVTEVIEGLHQAQVRVLAEFTRPIVHGLLVRFGTSWADITTLVSHPQALGQCRHTVRQQLPQSTVLPVASTAQAAEQVANGLASAALGTAEVADMLNLTVLQPQMSDNPNNQTRFMVLTAHPTLTLTHTDAMPVKTALRVDVGDYPGSLVDVLLVFKRANLNLTRIESRPSRLGLGRYQFYIDVAADLNQLNTQSLLPDLSQYFCTQVEAKGPFKQLGQLDI
jgi:prephenate dehydratase